MGRGWKRANQAPRQSLTRQNESANSKPDTSHDGGGTLTSIPLRFEEAVEQYTLATDLLIVGVDNNACRLAAVSFARKNHIPAVFTMLSLDGMRCQCFLQGPDDCDACLWCALPNLDPEKTVPCAAAVISSCFLAGSFALFFAHRAIMGWPQGVKVFNWREGDLQSASAPTAGLIRQRVDCLACSSLRFGQPTREF